VLRRAAAPVIVLCALAAPARAAAPGVVAWQDADAHVGQVVTVEGDVVAAHRTGTTCVLEFAADTPRAFRAVLLIPLLSDLPRDAEERYRGARVRVTGRIQRFQGRPEMVLRSPEQIVEVVAAPEDRAAPFAAPPPPATLPSPAAPPPPVVPPPPAASPPPVTPPPPAPPATLSVPPDRGVGTPPAGRTEVPLPPSVPASVRPDPCAAARARWRDAAATARTRMAALHDCLATGSFLCRPDAAALGAALGSLDQAERLVEDACR
jgi:hypothetical protein